MLLNSETDYAIRILSNLVGRTERVDAATIAKETGVTPRFTLKILHSLVGANIVKSFKGNKGGYLLARPAEEITLLEVFEHISGPLTVSRCQHDSKNCTNPKGICEFKDVFEDVTSYMRKRLSEVNFKEI